MDRYTLKSKSGENITYVEAHDLYEAQEKLSKIKVLSISQLLDIFIVEKVKEKAII